MLWFLGGFCLASSLVGGINKQEGSRGSNGTNSRRHKRGCRRKAKYCGGETGSHSFPAGELFSPLPFPFPTLPLSISLFFALLQTPRSFPVLPMPIRKDMGKYDSIKPLHDCDLANETAVLINPDSLTLFSVSHHCNHSHEDVEMALLDSHSRSPLPLHNANPLTPPASSKLDDAQFSSSARPILRSSPPGQRLASLDVFRGITVAVILFFSFPFLLSFFLSFFFPLLLSLLSLFVGFCSCSSIGWNDLISCLYYRPLRFLVADGLEEKEHWSHCGLVFYYFFKRNKNIRIWLPEFYRPSVEIGRNNIYFDF